jgi:hypothetical protein
MKSLSDALLDLAGRVSELESSAAATLSDNREALLARRHALEAAMDRELKSMETAGSEAQTTARRWWADTQESVERQVEKMRTQFGRWEDERKLETAELTASLAEEEARAAIALANRVVLAAEYAALDAHLARAEARTLAGEE